ncbi:hypothetical protein L0668_11465 [Paraglaciecola aquimarina]|uniref:Uncharacterized protein n=1 Tax=Paraglaciecola algarum TaxID=3050085 RepID=A0ABS9D9P0_9ALTE|nr:hypothetical protein [Paraglaciecola sp. G1-23]MCF2948728.1 hypothetical protein [Paraglaciecola sp. G1-23]
MSLTTDYTATLANNISPTSAVLGAFLFNEFSYQEKCTYLQGLKSGLLSYDLVRFCISNLELEDTLLELFEFPDRGGNSRITYTLEPFQDISSLLKDLKTKLYLFNPCDEESFQSSVNDFFIVLNSVQQLLVFDFYEFGATGVFGRHIKITDSHDDIVKVDYLAELIKQHSSYHAACDISDLTYSIFFNSTLFDKKKYIFTPRLIQFNKLEYNKQYLDPSGESTIYSESTIDIASINELLNSLCDDNRRNSASYSVLGSAFFPSTDNAINVFSRLFEGDKNTELKTSAFLENTNNYAANSLVHEILSTYTQEEHEEWKNRYWEVAYLGGTWGNKVAAILSNPNSIEQTGRYLFDNLLDNTDVQSLLILSAIANFSPLPSSICCYIDNYVYQQIKIEDHSISRFNNKDFRCDYNEYKDFSEKYGDDTEFLSNLFYGFRLRNKCIFADESVPSRKYELNKYLVFTDGALKLVNHITRLREDFIEYLNSKELEEFWDMALSKKSAIEREFIEQNDYNKYILAELKSERIKKCLYSYAFRVKELDDLGLLFRILGIEDAELVNDTIALSPISSTDFLGTSRVESLISNNNHVITSSVNNLSEKVEEQALFQKAKMEDEYNKMRNELSIMQSMQKEIESTQRETTDAIKLLSQKIVTPSRSSFHVINFTLLTAIIIGSLFVMHN